MKHDQEFYDKEGQPAILIEECLTEFEGPYECPYCSGHMKLDSTYLDQVSEYVHCPYCCMEIKIKEPT